MKLLLLVRHNKKNILDIKNMVIADTDSKNPSTICLSTSSNIFIVHKSSMGSQALSASKNVILLLKIHIRIVLLITA